MKKTIIFLVMLLFLVGVHAQSYIPDAINTPETPEELLKKAEKLLDDNKEQIKKAEETQRKLDLKVRAEAMVATARSNLEKTEPAFRKAITNLETALQSKEGVAEALEDFKQKMEAYKKASSDVIVADIRAAAMTSDTDKLWGYISDNIFSYTGTWLAAYQDYGNFLSWTSIFHGLTKSDIQARKQKLANEFCLLGGIDHCFTSLICMSKFDRSVGQSVISLDLSGLPINTASLSAYKIGPIKVKGLPRHILIDWFGNRSVIKGVVYDFTHPDFNSDNLPEIDLFLYQVQYFLSNPEGIQERGFYRPSAVMKYNLEFKIDKPNVKSSVNWWSDNQNLVVGNSTNDNLFKYSFTDYDKVCLTFSPSIFSFSPRYLPATDRSKVAKSNICQNFVVYDGPPTLITNDPSKSNPSTQPSGTPGANV